MSQHDAETKASQGGDDELDAVTTEFEAAGADDEGFDDFNEDESEESDSAREQRGGRTSGGGLTEAVEAQMRELVAFISESLVDEPDQVRVHGEVEDGQLRLELTVAADDVGKVIGREGRTARAMRTLLATSAAKQRCRVNLQILE